MEIKKGAKVSRLILQQNGWVKMDNTAGKHGLYAKGTKRLLFNYVDKKIKAINDTKESSFTRE